MAQPDFTKAQRIIYLTTRYIDGSIDFPELQELDSWRKEDVDNETLFQKAIDTERQDQAVNRMQSYDTEGSLHKIRQLIQSGDNDTKSSKRIWPILLAAASFIVLVGSFVSLYYKQQKHSTALNLKPHPTFIAPGSDKAVLTLASGHKVILNKNANGIIGTQGNVQIQNSATGKLTYTQNVQATPGTDVAFNIIETPPGGQYRLELSDGTKVWLNAASSLRYPTSFKGRQREVTLTGEGYFEVVHNAKQPFIVKSASQTIKDIGTSFNLNTYTDEPYNTTTLVDGAIQLTAGDKKVLLIPGQQATNKSNTITISKADIETATAWRHGQLAFHRNNIQNVLRQISRWYNIEIEYQGKAPEFTISGEVSRQADLSAMLKILQLSDVHFVQQGRKLIISN